QEWIACLGCGFFIVHATDEANAAYSQPGRRRSHSQAGFSGPNFIPVLAIQDRSLNRVVSRGKLEMLSVDEMAALQGLHLADRNSERDVILKLLHHFEFLVLYQHNVGNMSRLLIGPFGNKG